MWMCDVNVLVAGFRIDHSQHSLHRGCLRALQRGPAALAWSDLVLSGFLRVVTGPKAFSPPSTQAEALAFLDALLATPGSVQLRPGPQHWRLFRDLLAATGARGKLVPDAYHAALAIEHNCDWVTSDGDFQRFRGLRTIHPARLVQP